MMLYPAPAAAVLLLLLSLAAVQAEKCGKNEGGRRCSSSQDCCSIYGWCGRGERFCSPAKCHSGACWGRPSPTPKPAPLGPTKVASAWEGNTATAVCVSGQIIGSIDAAIYGNLAKRCNASTAYGLVRRRCLGQRTCSIAASDSVFGRTCPEISGKALLFKYRCRGSSHGGGGAHRPRPPPIPQPDSKGYRVVSARRWKMVDARCPRGQVMLEFANAIYGNLGRGCKSGATLRLVEGKCKGKNACRMYASKALFGKPCPKGVKESLSFKYRCGVRSNPAPKPKPKPNRQPKPNPRPRPGPSPALPANTVVSNIWGTKGRRWQPTSRLADWSYAGYMGNTRSVPYYRDTGEFNVMKFGARGDGQHDDTLAIKKAILAASAKAVELTTIKCGSAYYSKRCLPPHNGFLNNGQKGAVVYLPPGTYKVTQALDITQSNVVIRGAGFKKTKLWFPKGLQAIYGNAQLWATGGAYITIDGNNAGSNQRQYAITKVVANARKGDEFLRVDSSDSIKIGQWVRVYALAPSPAKRRLLWADEALGSISATSLNSTSSSSNNNNAGGSKTAGGDSKAASGFLPLTPVLEKQAGIALEYADAELTLDGVTAAAQPGTLDAYLYGENMVDSGRNAFRGTDHIRFSFKVVAKGPGWIKLERPLPYDVRTAWQPFVYEFYSTVQHSGVEMLTMQFAWDVYPEHLKSKGYNAIAMTSVSNCWVRWVNIIDADNGVQVTQSDFLTVTGVTMSVTKPRWTQETFGDNGHHALWVGKSGDVAFTNFRLNNAYMHDLSVDGFSERCVFARGYGVNLNIDCHRAGANNTFWNLRAQTVVQLPDDCDFGPLLNFVGTFRAPDGYSLPTGVRPSKPSVFPAWCARETRWYVELVPAGKQLYPKDLFSAMVSSRKQRLGQ